MEIGYDEDSAITVTGILITDDGSKRTMPGG